MPRPPLRALHAHPSEVSARVGDALERGDAVGLLGDTGYSTGPHLHYEVHRRGVPRDPAGFLPGPTAAAR